MDTLRALAPPSGAHVVVSADPNFRVLNPKTSQIGIYSDSSGSMTRHTLSRRRFLQVTAAAGLAVPAVVAGVDLYDAQGDLPTPVSPYADAPEPVHGAASAPILILTAEGGANVFSPYLAEILSAEGLAAFQVAPMSALGPDLVAQVDLIVLAEGALSTTQRETLEAFVRAGGRLVAMRPTAELAPLLGVEPASGATEEGYWIVDTYHPYGRGISEQPLQFHGRADHYTLAGARPIAWLTDRVGAERRRPAVCVHPVGQGQAVLWAFDLAKSIVYMRQGNPALANRPEPSWSGLRAVNMFVDWVDLERLPIPQADEAQRLLANILTGLSQGRRPLPRWWYFPATTPGVLIATGDNHASYFEAADTLLRIVEQYRGQFSVYYTPQEISYLSRAGRRALYRAAPVPWVGDRLIDRFHSPPASSVNEWRGRGHEWALHPYVDETSVVPGLEAGWLHYWRQFTGQGYGPVPPTVRTHRIIWSGWVETARVQASFGMRLNLDYYHWGPLFQRPDQSWAWGYLTGSGLPMRFINEQGRVLKIYQLLTELADDHMLELRWGNEVRGIANLPAAEAVAVSRALIGAAAARYPSALVGQFHVDPFLTELLYRQRAETFLEGTLAAAVEHNLPIWSAERFLYFSEARAAAGLDQVTWDAASRRLGFTTRFGRDSGEPLELLIPLTHQGFRLVTITADGARAPYAERRVGGVAYAGVAVPTRAMRFVVEYQ